jgi:Ribbon-helix-helix domain
MGFDMKRRITVRIPEQIVERLQAAAALLGIRKSCIVETALDRFLDRDGDAATVARRLDRVGHRLDALEHELKIVGETVALHARYHLTITPALPAADQSQACLVGHQRFEEFAAQVARRVFLNSPLMRETMERMIATRPGLFACDLQWESPLLKSSHSND